MNTKKLFLSMTLLMCLFAWTAKADSTVKVGSSDGGTTLSPGADYKSMTAAFNALNTFTGVVNLQIIDNTTETSTIYYTKSASWTTLNIYPTVTGKTISGNISGPLFNLTAVSGMVIDGRLHNADGSLNGSTRDLTITNTGGATVLGAITIRLEGNSSGNTIKYCTIKGSGTANYRGIICILAGATLATGNGNNTISNNLFTCADNAKRPTWSILSVGTSAAYPNNNLTITDNEFADFLSTNAGQGTGGAINLGASTSACTITGNSFYETTSFIPTASALTCSVISVSNGSGTGFNISNNYIGGSAALCAGLNPFRKTNALDNPFYAINVTVGGTPVTTVTNNTIQHIEWGNSANAMWTGINIGGAAINVTGNTIGATTGTGSINYTGAGATAAQFYGINFGQTATSVGTGNCSNNNIGSITMNTVPAAIYGLFNSSAGTSYFQNNIIGSTTTANSINAAATGAHNIQIIRQNGAGNTTISGNTIANITNSTTSSSSTLQVMLVGNGNNIINGNFISNIFSPNSTSAAKASTYGVNIYNSAAGSTSTLSNNIISLGGDAACNIIGIQEANSGGTSTTNMYYNTIYIGGNEGSGSTAKSYCLTSSNGSTFNKNIKNNVLVNARSTVGGSSQHYAFSASAPSGTFVCDYNDYFVSGEGSKLGAFASADKTTSVIVTGQDVNSKAVDPSFTGAAAITAGTAVATDYKATNSALLGVSGNGVTTDYNANTRSTSPKMGAYEPSATWNGSAWDVSPTSTINAVINGTFSGAGFSCLDLTINAGKQTTISSGALSVAGNLLLKSDASNGTATFIDNPGTLNVTGTTSVQQYLSAGRNWYISSPVSGASSNVVSASVLNPLYYYVEASPNTWSSITNTSTALNVDMKGYIANVANTGVVTFTGGTLNTGNVTAKSITGLTRQEVSFQGFNLIGNPYPSYVSWDAANLSNVGTSIWYRSKSTGAYLFQTYNSSGGQGTNNGTTYIPPMQAFWVQIPSTGTGSVTFPNTARSHQDQSVVNNQLKAPAINTQKVLRLEVSNTVNTDETVLYFDANAADVFDAYDSPKMKNNTATIPEIYTTVGTENLAINGMNSIPYNVELPLGFTSGQSNTFTIKASEIAHFDAGTQIILKDNQTYSVQDLSDGSTYHFSSDAVSTTSRFTLMFKSSSVATALNSSIDNSNSVFVFRNANNQIAVNIPCEMLGKASASVYTAIGQKIMSKNLTQTNSQLGTSLQPGVYIVTISNAGKTITRKVIID